MEAELSVPVGVVVERRTSTSRWAEHRWRPISVFTGRSPLEGWHEMRSGEGWTRFCSGTCRLDLHRADAEEYKRNLTSPRPGIFVVLARAKGDIPWKVHLVTASPSEAEAYTVGGDHIVEGLPLPEDLANAIGEFTDTHYKPAPFRKRQRDTPPALEEPRFGKEPIFTRPRDTKGSGNGQ